MAVYKDAGRKTWYVRYSCKRADGKWTHTTKRGFATRKEAVQWEMDFQLSRANQPEMWLSEFTETYFSDMSPRLRESTLKLRRMIAEKWILPQLGKTPLRDLTPQAVLRWQAGLLAYRDPRTGKPLSVSYIRQIQDTLSGMLNHAVRFYKLSANPAKVVDKPRNDQSEMAIWSREEYGRFAAVMMERPVLYYCFQLLYWCGLREGEALALERGDVDLEKGTVSVTKTYYKLGGKSVTAPPKTEKSRREVTMPDFLRDELADYIRLIYDRNPTDRLFPLEKKALNQAMTWGAKKAGLPRIRVHDLRHSHISLLLHMGYSAVAIGKRVGHKSTEITYRYGHLMPTEQEQMARRLNLEAG